jgi:hypothetical protein
LAEDRQFLDLIAGFTAAAHSESMPEFSAVIGSPSPNTIGAG